MKRFTILVCNFILISLSTLGNPAPDASEHADDTVRIRVSDSIKVQIEPQETVVMKSDTIDGDGWDIIISTTDGIKVTKEPYEFKRLTISSFMMDIGLNGLHDQTRYNSSEAAQFMRVDDNIRNANFMNIKTWSSRNFNMWPVIINLNTVKSRNQKLLISSGIGFQWYNYKFSNSVDLIGGTDPHIIESDLHFSKNKLGITYLSVPLLITGQSRISSNYWLTYGVGVIGGYKVVSWTNQNSAESGKIKERDPYNMEPFQWSVTGEIGVKGILRLYATYQMTNIWKSGLHQQPFAMGIRIFGI